ncbi:hypothetical protein CES85_1684 [Ochrobactrum quorumnocens]|uniref:Uncharacterized protein n=1 Tax=Ochrobactrum quorumnocens TaxID=271865 RepID=A0A248UIE2_9HYPH|nr:hypothetical protein CES85_1684 [[Ochrobactrum] quorumnocens]
MRALTPLQNETLALINQGKVYQQKFGYGAWRIQGANPTVVGKLISMGVAEWDRDCKSFVRIDCVLTDAGRSTRQTGDRDAS